MRLLVIDGQSGRMGQVLIERIRSAGLPCEIIAVGTNAIATSAMLKAGADHGATGENPCIVNARDSHIIIGPIGIVFADALLGEITPAIAQAVGSSKAYKILIPVNRCSHYIVGCQETGLGEYIRMVCEKVDSLLSGGSVC